jgi:hypothetical protein
MPPLPRTDDVEMGKLATYHDSQRLAQTAGGWQYLIRIRVGDQGSGIRTEVGVPFGSLTGTARLAPEMGLRYAPARGYGLSGRVPQVPGLNDRLASPSCAGLRNHRFDRDGRNARAPTPRAWCCRQSASCGVTVAGRRMRTLPDAWRGARPSLHADGEASRRHLFGGEDDGGSSAGSAGRRN